MYTAKVIEKIGEGWGKLRVGVFDEDSKIGEYVRNYDSFGESTFCPFQLRGKWYALYSAHYTCTRIMSLPDCKDIGGEDPSANGFCPVDYYVPELTAHAHDPIDKRPIVANHRADVWAHKVPYEGGVRYYWPDDKNHPEPNEERKTAYLKAREESHKELDAWSDRHPFVNQHAPFGFVAGCVWGDDGSWKLKYIDLSRADEGVLAVDDRFGYAEVKTPLSKNIEVSDPDNLLNYNPNNLRVAIYQRTAYVMNGTKQAM